MKDYIKEDIIRHLSNNTEAVKALNDYLINHINQDKPILALVDDEEFGKLQDRVIDSMSAVKATIAAAGLMEKLNNLKENKEDVQ